MVYISRTGTVQQKRTGVLAVLLGFLYTLLDIVQTFFYTLISPDAQQTVLKKRRDDYSGGGGGGSGRPGGGPRITGLDKMQGGSGAAACASGG